MCAICDISPSITLKCCFRLSRCSRLQSNRTKLQHLQRMRLLRLDKTCSPCTLSWELCKARWAGEVKPKCLFDVTTRSAWHCPVYFVEASNTFPHLQRNVVGDHLILPLTKLQRLKTRKNNYKKTPKKKSNFVFFRFFFFFNGNTLQDSLMNLWKFDEDRFSHLSEKLWCTDRQTALLWCRLSSLQKINLQYRYIF